MTRFADLADAGRRLAPLVVAAGLDDPVLLAIIPNGVPVAEPIADELGATIIGVVLDRAGEPRVTELPDIAGRAVVVVDDGVETGTAARLVGQAARAGHVASLVLAVPVCPREAQASLDAAYDQIIAIERPLVRRDLRWHYDDLDGIDEAEARRRLVDR